MKTVIFVVLAIVFVLFAHLGYTTVRFWYKIHHTYSTWSFQDKLAIAGVIAALAICIIIGCFAAALL